MVTIIRMMLIIVRLIFSEHDEIARIWDIYCLTRLVANLPQIYHGVTSESTYSVILNRTSFNWKKKNKKQKTTKKKHLPVHAQKPILFAFEKFSQKIASVDHYLSPNLTGWCFSVHFHITKGSLSSTIRKSKLFWFWFLFWSVRRISYFFTFPVLT